MNLIAFWTLDIRGFIGLYLVVVAPFSGLYVPVHLFPDWLRTIAYATPFPSLLQLPIDVLSGRVLGLDALLVGHADRLARPAGRPDARLMMRGPPGGWWCRVAELTRRAGHRPTRVDQGAARLPDPQPDAYRTSFWLTVATSVGVGLIEFVEIYVILANVPVFGGLTFAQARAGVRPGQHGVLAGRHGVRAVRLDAVPPPPRPAGGDAGPTAAADRCSSSPPTSSCAASAGWRSVW